MELYIIAKKERKRIKAKWKDAQGSNGKQTLKKRDEAGAVMLEFTRDNWIVGVIALVVVVYIWVLVFYRGGLRRKMTVALAEGEWQKYERLLL